MLFNVKFLKNFCVTKTKKNRIEYIYCGINFNTIENFMPNSKKIFSVCSGGSLVEKKGIVYLIEALKFLANKKILFCSYGRAAENRAAKIGLLQQPESKRVI